MRAAAFKVHTCSARGRIYKALRGPRCKQLINYIVSQFFDCASLFDGRKFGPKLFA